MADEKKVSIVTQIAALLFYNAMKEDKKGEPCPQFEELEEKKQHPYIARSVEMMGALDKLNLKIILRPDARKEELTEARKVEELKEVIGGFVKGLKTTKPALFPVEELALRILRR